MRFVKGIGLYFLYPLVFLLLGFAGGLCFVEYFYPFKEELPREELGLDKDFELSNQDSEEFSTNGFLNTESENSTLNQVSNIKEILTADTSLVVWEYDLSTNTLVETTRELAEKYMGMDREQYIESMNEYEYSPPLSEQEKGFESLEVISFSRDRVILQINYRSQAMEETYYLLAYNGYVVVFLEDMETIYLYTDILLENLPFELQQEIISAKQIIGEEELYHFLENFTS